MFKKLMDIHFITQMSNILTNKGLWWGLHEIAKQGCNFLLLLVLQPYKISPKRSQLLPFSIKIWQNFKSTTFPSDLPLSYSAKISDFCHSVIRAMIRKRSRCLTPRVLMICCVLLRSHLYATQLLTEEHTVLAQVYTIYSLYTLDCWGSNSVYGLMWKKITLMSSLLRSLNGKNLKFLHCSSVEDLMEMLFFYNFAIF